MSFVEPLFLLGVIAAGVPIAIHLINRRRAARQPFPAMRLLEASKKREASSVKIRQWLLLALRALVLALLALALAKPFMVSEEGIRADARLPTAVVMVIDDSASMGQGDWWERAQEAAEERVERLRPWDEVALITTSRLDGPVGRLTSAHQEVIDAVGELEPGARSTDLGEALAAAEGVLSASQLPAQRIVVVSDFARGGFPAEGAPREKVQREVEQIDVRRPGQERVPNVAVVGVDYAQRQAGEGALWEVRATVENRGVGVAEGVEVQLVVGGDVLATDVVEIPAGERLVQVFEHRFDGGGARRASIRVDAPEDAYAADDVYRFVVRVKDRVRLLLVNGEPTSVAYSDELFFFTRAMNPGTSSQSAMDPLTTTPDALATRELDAFDVVVLANVSSVGAEAAERLHRFVEQGGGLLLAMGDQVDVEGWNRTLGELLPKPLRGRKRLAEREDPDAPVKVTRMGAAEGAHPVFRVFELPGGASLQSAQVYSYMLLQPGASGDARTVLRYRDESPALIERRLGDGRVMLWTTTLDREWTDFPVRTAYLPLMRRAVQYLARRVTSRGQADPVVGERVELDVGGLVREQVVVRGPGEVRIVAQAADGAVSVSPEEVGFWEVWADDDTPRGDVDAPRNRLDELSFAVNVPRSESELEALPEGALDAWIAPAAELTGEGPTRERRVNLWSPLLFAITLMLLLETLVGTRRSVIRRLLRRVFGGQAGRVEV